MGRCQGTFLEQSALDLLVGDLLVAFNGDLMHLHLHLLVNRDVEDHLVLVGHIIALHDVDLSVLVTLVIEVFLGKDLGTVDHVRRNLTALQQAELLLHVLAFAFLQTDIVDVCYTWTH